MSCSFSSKVEVLRLVMLGLNWDEGVNENTVYRGPLLIIIIHSINDSLLHYNGHLFQMIIFFVSATCQYASGLSRFWSYETFRLPSQFWRRINEHLNVKSSVIRWLYPQYLSDENNGAFAWIFVKCFCKKTFVIIIIIRYTPTSFYSAHHYS